MRSIPRASRSRQSVAGAWVDPSLSWLWLLGVGFWLWRAWGRSAAWAGAWVLALAPLAIQSGPLGCADHHLHELFGAAAMALLAGEYTIRWACLYGVSVMIEPSGWAGAEGSGEVRLEAGHHYTTHCDRTTGWGYETFQWLKDDTTGTVVAGARKP